jgi:hypothetical protein
MTEHEGEIAGQMFEAASAVIAAGALLLFILSPAIAGQDTRSALYIVWGLAWGFFMGVLMGGGA